MESSSENSFAWTDTSSDSTSMAADDSNEKLDEKDYKNKKKKMSLTGKLANDESVLKGYIADIKGEQSNNVSKTNNNNSNNSVTKKMIKSEPESDYDLPKKKKKIKDKKSNGNENDSQGSISYDETYLNMKVKQEELDSSSSKHKQKKQKQQLSTNSKIQQTSKENRQSESTNENVQESEYDTSNSKKKKKKTKRRYDSGDHNLELVSKMDIDRTVVNKQEYFVKENTTFHEESEESGCDEISAIKYDDEHNLHTISKINKSLEGLNKTKIDNGSNETKSSSQHDYKEKTEATQHRTQKISDRIRFEDDDDEEIMNSRRIGAHESDFENSRKSVKLEQFIRENSDLKLLSNKLDNNTRLSSDDEIWILKCPKEIDTKDFENTSLNMHSKCKIKIAGQTYDGSVEEEHLGTVPLLTIHNNKYKIRNLPLTGIVCLRKRIPKAHFRDDNVMVNNQTNFIPLPDTKCRHPLFGSNYKKALKIPTAIAERLNMQDGQESSLQAERRKKKKDKKHRNNTNTVEHVIPLEQHDIMKLESHASVEITEKKKKKRKIVDDDGPSKKVKRMRHDLESAEAWESEKAIEENLFNF